MTTKEVSSERAEVRSSIVDDGHQLPPYSAVDDSVVIVPGQTPDSATAQWTTAPDSTPSPSYPTAEQEKALLQAEWAEASAGARTPISNASDTFAPNPEGNGAGHASEALLSRGLQVPSANRFVSSGFPYPEILAKYQVTPEEWNAFTGEITRAASMTSSDWALAVGGGAGTFLVSGLIVGWLGVIPAYFVGRNLHRKCETENLAKARNTGDLEEKLLKWNREVFAPRGILIRLDLPGESYDIGKMDVLAKRPTGGCWSGGCCSSRSSRCGGSSSEKKQAKMQQKMEKAAEKMAKKELKSKMKATKRGRIVILPLNKDAAATTPTAAEAERQIPSPTGQTDLYASSAV